MITDDIIVDDLKYINKPKFHWVPKNSLSSNQLKEIYKSHLKKLKDKKKKFLSKYFQESKKNKLTFQELKFMINSLPKDYTSNSSLKKLDIIKKERKIIKQNSKNMIKSYIKKKESLKSKIAALEDKILDISPSLSNKTSMDVNNKKKYKTSNIIALNKHVDKLDDSLKKRTKILDKKLQLETNTL